VSPWGTLVEPKTAGGSRTLSESSVDSQGPHQTEPSNGARGKSDFPMNGRKPIRTIQEHHQKNNENR